MTAPKAWLPAVALALLCLPSARVAWICQDLPQFGFLHDDGLYLVSAKSLADGNGYRIESFPDAPAQTKYPPAYPALLILAWKLGGAAHVMPWAAWLSWLTIPAILALSLCFLKDCGLPPWQVWTVVTLLAWNPYVALFGVNLLSENLCTALVLLTLVLARRGSPVGSGLAAAAAVLTRTAAAALALPLALLPKRRGLALGPLLAAGAGWFLWTSAHRVHGDWVVTYYTDYLRYQIENISFDLIPTLLWKNLDGLLYGMGSLALPKVIDLLPAKILAQVFGAAMIAGVVRLWRRNIARDYTLFALPSCALLLVWHFPPTERFVLPMAPLLMAGLVTEAAHFAALLAKGWTKGKAGDRGAAVAIGGLAASIAAGAVGLQLFTGQAFIPDTAQTQRAQRSWRQADYQWIRERLPSGAILIAYDDVPLYLNTGRRAFMLPLPTRFWYREDHEANIGVYRRADQTANAHGARYVYVTDADFTRDATPGERDAMLGVLRDNRNLHAIYRTAHSAIFEVK